jgi:hypothetical protein
VHVRCDWAPERAIYHPTLGELRARGGAIFQGSRWASERGVREFGRIEVLGFDVECVLPDREYLVLQNGEEVLVNSECRFVSHGRPTRIWIDRNWFVGEEHITPCGQVRWEGCHTENVELWVGLNGDRYDPREPHLFESGKRVGSK